MEKDAQEEKTVLIKPSENIRLLDQDGKPIEGLRGKITPKELAVLFKLANGVQLPPAHKRDPLHLLIIDIQPDFTTKLVLVPNWGSTVEDSDGRIYRITPYSKKPGESDDRQYKLWVPYPLFSPALKNLKTGLMEHFWIPAEIFWYGSEMPYDFNNGLRHDPMTDGEQQSFYNDGIKVERMKEREAMKSKEYILYIMGGFLGMIGIANLMMLMSG